MKIPKVYNGNQIFTIETGKVLLGSSIGGGTALSAAAGKVVGDIAEFAAKKVDIKRGFQNGQYNPLNLLESAEVLIKRFLKK